MSPDIPLDDPGRGLLLRDTIRRKAGLRRLYQETYERYRLCLLRCPPAGLAVELGSGGGFVKEVLPEVLTTDPLPYPTVEQVVDARRLPFRAGSLRAIFMLNVFHHIPDVEMFLGEASRCLSPGGRLLVIDQYPGLISGPMFRYMHHEPYQPDAADWCFISCGPLSCANGALAWIVFERDRSRFSHLFPRLRIERVEPHTPLRYWLAGGLKRWSLLPACAFGAATWLDRRLLGLSPRFGSFVDVELVRI